MTKNVPEIFESKFGIPTIPPNFIPRPGLFNRLEDGIKRKLTLISAPAGFGKSSTVACWLKSVDYSRVWVSLSRDDNDPIHLVKIFIKGNQKIKKDFGDTILNNFNALCANPIIGLVRMTIKEMETLPDDHIIVFDDFHYLHLPVVQEWLPQFLNHMPNQCHLYIISRTQLPIPLTRHKVKGDISEIRENDLRFNFKETTDFFSKTANIELLPHEIRYFYKITEGWPAGLRMISFSIKTREDTSDIFEMVSDSSRDISYYLEEEVFSLQSKEVQNFLLATSILSTLTPSLCDAVSGRNDSWQMLKMLEELNLFTILLDHKTSLYRYHHFFSDMLLKRLWEASPDNAKELHLKAAEWYLENNLVEEAVFHAYKSENMTFHAEVIESNLEAAILNGQLLKAEKWLSQIPENILQDRPVLMVWKSAILLFVHSKIEKVEESISIAEKKILKQLSLKGTSLPLQSKETAEKMYGMILFLKASALARRNQYSEAKKIIAEALKHIPPNGIHHAIVSLNYGYFSLTEGKIDDAEVRSFEVMSQYRQVVTPYIEAASIFMRVLIELERGRLNIANSIVSQAISKHEDSLNSSDTQIDPFASLLIMKGEILRERNQLDEAELLIKKGIELIQYVMPYNVIAYGDSCLSRIALSKGNIDAAMAITEEMEKKCWPVNFYITEYLPAYKAKLFIINGDLEKAEQFIKHPHDRQLGKIVIKNAIHYSEYLSCARYYIAKEDYEQALDILEKLLKQSKADQRMKQYLEALILSSLALGRKGCAEDAKLKLIEAVKLSAPEGYCRIYLDEGSEIIDMLNELLINHDQHDIEEDIFYIKRLTCGLIAENESGQPDTNPKKVLPLSYQQDPLTKRELEVLSQLSLGLSNKEIGDRLCISIPTVKTHISSIMSKLNADNRNKAVIEAQKMGLIDEKNIQ